MIMAMLGLLACAPGLDAPGFEPDLACDEAAPPTVGTAPLRRLTRSQYAHTVRDLFSVTGDQAGLLDADERVGTFAANAATPVSRITVEQYQQAAEAVARDTDIGALDDCNLLVEEPAACARRFVTAWLPRVYRRPATDEQVQAYVDLYAAFADQGHLEALRVVLTGMLQSPWFLYHHELPDPGSAGPGALEPLDGYSMASRLSFFLWGSGPDAALLAAASAGGLATVEGVEGQALRLLADPRAARGIGQLHLEWMGVDELDEVAKDPARFPDWDAATREALARDVVDYVDAIVRYGDGELATLLTAHVPGVDGEPDRVGILTRPGVLATHAHYQRSSLTLRGRLVREELLCQPLPDPPPDVDISLPDVSVGLTTREAVAAHLTDPSCASCHAAIDPLGFAFEHYDAVGAYRELENGRPVDASGELTGSDVDGPFDGAVGLAFVLAESGEVRWCVTRQWFRYALGRSERPADACSLAEGWAAMGRPGNLRELALAIVTSDAFRHRRAP